MTKLLLGVITKASTSWIRPPSVNWKLVHASNGAAVSGPVTQNVERVSFPGVLGCRPCLHRCEPDSTGPQASEIHDTRSPATRAPLLRVAGRGLGATPPLSSRS